MRTMIHIFKPSFAQIIKVEATKTINGIPDVTPTIQKKLIFGPFTRAPGMILPKILQGHSFCTPHSSAKFRPNTSIFPRDMQKVF